MVQTGGAGTDNIEKISSLAVAVTTVNAATYNLAKGDFVLNITYTSTGIVTITLPTAQAIEGRLIHIKDAGFNAGTNNITIETGGAELIEGQSNLVLNGDGDAPMLYSDGTDWFII